MNATTPIPAWLTADWLTDVLRRSGDLRHGRVESFSADVRATVISNVGRIHPVYSGPREDGPRSLFFKTLREDMRDTFMRGYRREAEFYVSAAPLTPRLLLPRCYDASFREEGPTFHLLLEDLSESHFVVSQWPLPPTDLQCEEILRTYGRFHAAWWDHRELGTSVGRFLSEGEVENLLAEYGRRFALFADTLGDRLSPERRRRYERAIAAGARLIERRRSGRNVTLVHGDAHVWNCLYPHDPSSGRVRVIDWDSWNIDVAADDLAYMMALHWYPERRARLERRHLARYHETLVEQGVAGYDFQALWDDYRLSVVWQLSVPVWQCSLKIGPWVWWSHLERIMLAFEDLGCEELLG